MPKVGDRIRNTSWPNGVWTTIDEINPVGVYVKEGNTVIKLAYTKQLAELRYREPLVMEIYKNYEHHWDIREPREVNLWRRIILE